MDRVLTVIGDPASSTLDEAIAQAAGAALTEAGARVGPPDWLDPGHACDLPFGGLASEAAEAAVRDRLGDAAVDLAAQPAEGRRKGLLVADMESTIIGQEMIDELAKVAGLGERVEKITARSMAGEVDFVASVKERVALLEGLPVATLEAVGARITLNPGARTLVRTLRAAGAYTALVSGGFACFAEPVREACGFHEARSNRLIIEAGHLTGAVAQPILGRDAKRETLVELAARRGLPLEATCALGDGANDLTMVQAAGLGVAYRAKPVLRAAARFRVDHADLTALLYLQGYRRSEFRD
jgi:phosphoserine phosphatase